MTLEQFGSFCSNNKMQNQQRAFEYFCVFGGMDTFVDEKKELDELIESKILKKYRFLHADITKITHSQQESHRILSAIATGDGRVHSALKRARLSRQDGETAINTLCVKKLLKREYSLESSPNEEEKVDEKLTFQTPFMRFWFAFVSPYFKSIKDDDFKETKEQFANRKQEFFEFAFKKLAVGVVQKSFADDAIVEIGSYWDRSTQIDVLAKTASGKIVAGVCKYSAQKAKKSELAKLKELCEAARIKADIFVIVSKGGFSSELKALKGNELRLFTLKNFLQQNDTP